MPSLSSKIQIISATSTLLPTVYARSTKMCDNRRKRTYWCLTPFEEHKVNVASLFESGGALMAEGQQIKAIQT